jgi:hypothetical protein
MAHFQSVEYSYRCRAYCRAFRHINDQTLDVSKKPKREFRYKCVGILEIEIDGTTVLVESSELSESGAKVVAATKVKVQKKFDEILAVIKPICSSIIKTNEQMPNKPNTTTAEFGLKFSVDGNLIFAKASPKRASRSLLESARYYNWTARLITYY